MKEPKYKSIFSSKIRCLFDKEKDKYLAQASLDKIKKFIPQIDTDKNYDLLPISANACVINRGNLNYDVIDTKTAIDIAPYFVNKFIDAEHNRGRILGFITNYGFSKFGSDEPLTEEEAAKMTGPFNLCLGGVIWKMANPKIADLLEESNDPTSNNYLSLSFSWELGFTNYGLVLLPDGKKNIEDGKVIVDEKEVNQLSAKLKQEGGTGRTDNGENIFRLANGGVIPLGVGITNSPAADVEGIAVQGDSDESIKAEIDDITNKIKENILNSINEKYELTLKSKNELNTEKDKELILAKNNNKNEEIISHSEKPNVNQNRLIMKITKVQDITDESLKTISASSIVEFINEEYKKAEDKWTAKQNEAKELEKKHNDLVAKHDELVKQSETIKADLDKIKAEAETRAKQEKFNQRMAHFDELYELSKEDSAILAKKLNKIDSDEAFAELENELTVLLSLKNKAAIKAAAEKIAAEEAAKKTKTEVKASTEEVKTAVENLEVDKTKGTAVATITAEPKNLTEKFAKAFDISEGFEYGNKRDKRKIYA